MAKRPEQAVEKQLLAQLNTWGYGLVPIKDEKDLVANLKTQLEKHNQIRFSEKEIEKVLNLQRPAIGYRVDHGPILPHPIEGATISKTRCVSSENFASFNGPPVLGEEGRLGAAVTRKRLRYLRLVRKAGTGALRCGVGSALPCFPVSQRP
jgi:hypothetical protein